MAAEGGGGWAPPGSLRRELLLTSLALVLLAAGWYLFAHRFDYCRPWHWIVPLAQLFAGAMAFGYSRLKAVQALGCVTLASAFPVAFIILLCGGFGPG